MLSLCNAGSHMTWPILLVVCTISSSTVITYLLKSHSDTGIPCDNTYFRGINSWILYMRIPDGWEKQKLWFSSHKKLRLFNFCKNTLEDYYVTCIFFFFPSQSQNKNLQNATLSDGKHVFFPLGEKKNHIIGCMNMILTGFSWL